MDLELGDRKLVTASSLLDYLASTYTYTMSVNTAAIGHMWLATEYLKCD